MSDKSINFASFFAPGKKKKTNGLKASRKIDKNLANDQVKCKCQ